VNSLNDLWGATLKSVELELVARRVLIRIEVPSQDQVQRHLVELEGVSDFRLNNDLDWSYVETTGVYLRPAERGRVQMEFIRWVDESTLTATSDRVILDGNPVPVLDPG
jgi:hypothetical protein